MSGEHRDIDFAATETPSSAGGNREAGSEVAVDAMESIGRYVVREKIGEGGMGVIYAAEDPQLGRMVALKLLRPGGGDEEDQRRLLREAQSLARVPHRNLVTVFDVGTHRGAVFIAMEYLKGETLEVWLARRKRRWGEILRVFVDAGRGLAAAHAAGLVHRDFKPGNVIVTAEGTAQVLDFGLARRGDASEVDLGSGSPVAPTDDTLAQDLTRAGGVLGTPAYMAPEQHLGVGVDARTDQFSYCVALYEALYGKRPFRGQDMVTLMEATLRGLKGLPPPQNDLPLEVRTALRRGLQPEREARFDAMEPLIEVLERASGPVRSGSGGWPWIVMGGAALVVFTAGLTLWLASDSSDESDPTLKTPEVSVPNVDGRRSRGKPAAPMGRAAPQGDEVLVPEFSVTTEDRLLPSIEELADPEPEGSTGATTGGRGAHEGGTEAAPRSTTEGQPALESPPPVPESLDASTGGQPLASPGGA